ncbi:MAG: hypothetical protein V1765_01185 [bacterium]
MYRKFLSLKLISAMLVVAGFLLATQALAADCQPPEVLSPTFNNSGDVSLNWKTVVGALQCEVEVYATNNPIIPVKTYKVPGNYSGITILSEELQCGDYNWQVRCQCCTDRCDNCAMTVPDDQTWCEAVESSYPSECFCNDQDWETTPWKDRSQLDKYFHLSGRDMDGNGLRGKTADIIMGCGWVCMKSGAFDEPKECGRDYKIDCGTGPHQRLVSDTPSYDLCKVDDGYKVKYLEKYYINAAYERTKVIDTIDGKEYQWDCLDKSCFSCRRAECGSAHDKYYTKEEIAKISIVDLCVSPIQAPFAFLQEAYPLSELNIQDNKIVWNCVGSQRCSVEDAQDKVANKNAVNIAPEGQVMASWVYLEDGCKAKLASCGTANNNFYTQATFEKKRSEGLQLSDGTNTADFLCMNGGTPSNPTLNLSETIDGTQLRNWSWNCSYPGGKQISGCNAYQVTCGLKVKGVYSMTQNSFDYYLNSNLSDNIHDKFCSNGRTNTLLGTEGITLASAYSAGPTDKDKSGNGTKDAWEWQCQDAEGGLTGVCALPKVDCEIPPTGKYYVDWNEFVSIEPKCTNGIAGHYASSLKSGWLWGCEDSLHDIVNCTAEQEACATGPHQGTYSSWEDFLAVGGTTCEGEGDTRTNCTNLCADPEEKVTVAFQVNASGVGGWSWQCQGAGGTAKLDCQADQLICKTPPHQYQEGYAGWNDFRDETILCTDPNTNNWDTATSANCVGVCSQEVDKDGDGIDDWVTVSKSVMGDFTWTCGTDQCSAKEVGCQAPPDQKTDFKDDEFKTSYLDNCSTKSGNIYTLTTDACKAKLCKNAPSGNLAVTYDPVNYTWSWTCGPKACQAKEAGCAYPHKDYFANSVTSENWYQCLWCNQKNEAGGCIGYTWKGGAGCDKLFCKNGITPTKIEEHPVYNSTTGEFDPEPRWTWDCGTNSCVAKIMECGPPLTNYGKYNGTDDIVSYYYTSHNTFVGWAQSTKTFPLCLNGGEIVWSREGIVNGDYGYSPNTKFYTYINQPTNYDYGYYTYLHDYNGQWMWQCKYTYNGQDKFFPQRNTGYRGSQESVFQRVPNSTAAPLSKNYCFLKELGQCQDSYAPNTLTKNDLKSKVANKKGLGTLCKYGYVQTLHPNDMGGKTSLSSTSNANTLACDDAGCSWYCGSTNRLDTQLSASCGPIDILGCKVPPHKGDYTEDEFRDAGYLTTGAPCENGTKAPVNYNSTTQKWGWDCQGDACWANKFCEPKINIGDDHSVCFLDIETYTPSVTECTDFTYDSWTVDLTKVNVVSGCGYGDSTCRVQGKSGAGQYTVTATITCNDACVPADKKTVSDTVTVTINEPKVTVSCPIVDGVEDCSICMNKGLALTATPADCNGTPTYQWYDVTNGGMTLLGTNSPYSFLKNASGDYKVKAKIKCGTCEAWSAEKTVTVKPTNNNLALTIEPASKAMCIGDPATTLTASHNGTCRGTASYNWANNNYISIKDASDVDPNHATFDPSGAIARSVETVRATVTCTSDTICYDPKTATTEATITVQEPEVSIAGATRSYDVCQGDTLDLTAVKQDCLGTASYNWYDEDTLDGIQHASTYTFDATDKSGTHVVYVGLICGDCNQGDREWPGDAVIIDITDAKNLGLVITKAPDNVCAGTDINLTAVVPADKEACNDGTYTWTDTYGGTTQTLACTGSTCTYDTTGKGKNGDEVHEINVSLVCRDECANPKAPLSVSAPSETITIKGVTALTAVITGGSDTMCIEELGNVFTVETNACEGDTPSPAWEPLRWVDNPYGLITQFTHDTAGVHTLSVAVTCEDNNCCYDPDSANASRQVTVVDPRPTITSDKYEICGNGEDTAILSATTTCQPAGYQWYNSNLPINGATAVDYPFSSLIPGTYSFKATTTCPDCIDDAKEWPSNVVDITVTELYDPEVRIFSETGKFEACSDKALKLIADVDPECVNPTYTWYLGDTDNELNNCFDKGECDVTFGDIATCTASQLVILAAKCEPGCLVEENISVLQPFTIKDPEVSIQADKEPICTSGEAWETVSNISIDDTTSILDCCTDYTHSWRDNGVPTNYTGVPIPYSTDVVGSHELTLSLGCDQCSAEGKVTVNAENPQEPVVSVTAKDSEGTVKDPLIFCKQENFTLEATASNCDDASYTWTSPPDNTTYDGATLLVAAGLTPGTHDFKVKLTCNQFCRLDPEETVTVTIRDCECGPAHEENYTQNTWDSNNISDLCNDGVTPSILQGPEPDNQWTWICDYGVIKPSCHANLVKCGDAKDQYYTQETWDGMFVDYTDNGNLVPFCTAGDLAIDDPYCTGTPSDNNCRYTGFTNAWRWDCLDSKGDTVTCDAYKVGCGIADANMAAENEVGLYQDVYSGGTDDLNKEGSYNTTNELRNSYAWKKCTNPNGSNVISASTPENNNKGKWQWNCSYGGQIAKCEARKNCVDADNPRPCGDDGTCYETVEFKVIADLRDSDTGRSPQCWTAEDVIAPDGTAKFNWQLAMDFDDTTWAGCRGKDLCNDKIGEDYQGACPEGWHVPSAQEDKGAWATLEYNLADNGCVDTSRLSNILDNDDEGLDCDGANSTVDGLRDWITFDAQPNTGSTSSNQGAEFWTSNYSDNLNGFGDNYGKDRDTENGETFAKGACKRYGRCEKSPIFYRTDNNGSSAVNRLYSDYIYDSLLKKWGYYTYYNNINHTNHQHYLRCVSDNSPDAQSVIKPGGGEGDGGLFGGTPPPCIGFGCFKLLF